MGRRLENRTLLDIVQEFQVISSQFSAEFGHRSAGSCRGHQERHQRLPRHRLYLSPGDARRQERLTGTRTPFDQHQYGGVLSGPVFRDRTHFIGSYEGTDQDSELVVTSALKPGAFPVTLDRNQGFAKVTHQLANNHYSQFRFNHDNGRPSAVSAAYAPGRRLQEKRASWEVQGTLDQRALAEDGERAAVSGL